LPSNPDAVLNFSPNGPFDLGLTLGPIGRGPWLRIERSEAWRATLTPDGPASLHLALGDGIVVAEAWGPGAEWAVAQSPALCGEEDDAGGFVPDSPLIKRLQRHAPGLRITKTKAVFEALVPAVLGQKVSGAEAHRAYLMLVRELGTQAPAHPQMIVPPGPAVLAATPYWTFHRFGVERRRAETIIRAARSAKRLEETASMDYSSARTRLEAFPGVGPWTAAMVALTALGDADAVPVGDYNLPHAVGYALDGTPRSTDERMLELLKPYRGHRGRVIRLLMAGHAGAPRFGPRMPLRNIAST
jgi:endonuclease III